MANIHQSAGYMITLVKEDVHFMYKKGNYFKANISNTYRFLQQRRLEAMNEEAVALHSPVRPPGAVEQHLILDGQPVGRHPEPLAVAPPPPLPGVTQPRRREQRLVHARAVPPQQRAVLVAHGPERAADGRAAREVGDGRGLPAQPVADAHHSDHLGVELRREAARRRAHTSRGRRAAHEAPPGLWRAGGTGTPGEVGVVGVAEGRHGRAGLVVVGRGAGLGWDVAVGHVRDDVVERGYEPVVDLLAAAQGRMPSSAVRPRGRSAHSSMATQVSPITLGNAPRCDRIRKGLFEI
jgi:hypothetical protein